MSRRNIIIQRIAIRRIIIINFQPLIRWINKQKGNDDNSRICVHLMIVRGKFCSTSEEEKNWRFKRPFRKHLIVRVVFFMELNKNSYKIYSYMMMKEAVNARLNNGFHWNSTAPFSIAPNIPRFNCIIWIGRNRDDTHIHNAMSIRRTKDMEWKLSEQSNCIYWIVVLQSYWMSARAWLVRVINILLSPLRQ